MPASAFGEPGTDKLGLVARRVVHDNVNVEIGRNVALDLIEEPAELLSAVTRHAFADDRRCLDVERGEQSGRAVALIVVGSPLSLTAAHRQQRLYAIKCLDLALFIDAQHQSKLRRIKVEPDDVAHLLNELWIDNQGGEE